MSVRHVHARPGEYIAVHRSGYRPSRRSSGGGGGGDDTGCLVILFVIAGIYILCNYLSVILWGAGIILGIYLICIFWNPVKRLFRKKSSSQLPPCQTNVPQLSMSNDSNDSYGKIIQNRKQE